MSLVTIICLELIKHEYMESYGIYKANISCVFTYIKELYWFNIETNDRLGVTLPGFKMSILKLYTYTICITDVNN